MTPRRERVDLSDTALAEPAPAVSSIEPAALEGSPQRGVIRSGKLAGMSMGRAIWVLSWPVLIESFLNSLVGVVDTTLAAGVSESATDAIGGAAYFLWFVLLVGTALGVGAGALISRAVGRGRLAVGSAVVGQCVTLSLVGGVVVGIAVAAVAPLVARILIRTPGVLAAPSIRRDAAPEADRPARRTRTRRTCVARRDAAGSEQPGRRTGRSRAAALSARRGPAAQATRGRVGTRR